MLGLDNPIHIAFILVLLLLVFGAKRLPELGKSLGAGLRGFKDSISGDESAPELGKVHSPALVDELPRQHDGAATAVAQQDVGRSPEPVVDRTPVHPAA
jgi:sec-independent protein translocase protein TatA